MPAAFVNNVSPFSACGSWLAFTMGTVLIETCIRWKLWVQNTICQMQTFVWGTTKWEMREYRQSYAFVTACLNTFKTVWWLDGERQRVLMWSFCCIYNTEDVNLKKSLELRFLISVSVWGMIPHPPTHPPKRVIFPSDIFSMQTCHDIFTSQTAAWIWFFHWNKTLNVSFGTQKENPGIKNENVMSLKLGHFIFFFSFLQLLKSYQFTEIYMPVKEKMPVSFFFYHFYSFRKEMETAVALYPMTHTKATM